MPATPVNRGTGPVPVRTIATTIGMVLATAVGLLVLYEVRRTLVWLVVAAFFTVALYPVVSWVQRRLAWCRRSLATLIVFLVVLVVLFLPRGVMQFVQSRTRFTVQLFVRNLTANRV